MSDVRMIDAVFDLTGESVPVDFPFSGWQALSHLIPALLDDARIGILPLRTSGAEKLLPKRSKLVLRIPFSLSESVAQLCDRELTLGAHTLRLGSCKLRELQASPTLHTPLLSTTSDEVAFMAEVSAQLAAHTIVAPMICGRLTSLRNSTQILSGYSLVIHDLKPADSLTLQANGLGANRRYGCGIFVPYKAITGLD